MNEKMHEGSAFPSGLQKMSHQIPTWVLVLLGVGVAAVVASRIAHLIVMLIAAAVIAYTFSFVISAFEKTGIKRSVAVVLLFALFSVCVIGADLIFIPHLKEEVLHAYAKLPEFKGEIRDALLLTAERSAERYPFIQLSIMKVVDAVFGPRGFLEKAPDAPEILMQATPFIMAPILVPFFVFFLLKDWPGMMKRVIDWVPPPYVETTISVIAEINILVGKYLRGLAADCFSVGVLASAGLWLIGINYPIMLGIVSGVANIIPYLGPILGCTVSALVAVVQYRSVDPLVSVIVLYLAIRLLDDLVIQPLLIGKSVHLHPMLLVITLIVGEKLFGVMGMILGVPVVTAAQKTVAILLEHRRETLSRETAGNLGRQDLGKSPVRPI
jgi:predicted PurR-regulated permease PerM